jgi:beta-phosphoglucomutase
MTIQGFLFDLDGVLTDTARFHYLAWKRLADELGIPFRRAQNEALRGISRRESLLLLLQGRACSEDQIEEWMERKNTYYLEFIRLIGPKNILPGAPGLLEEIHAAGLKAGLSSASKNASEVIARMGISGLFQAFSDGYSVEHQKPAPDLFLHTAAALGLPPAECAVFEDAAAGIEAAIAGGFVAVGLGPIERVGRAHLRLDSLAGVHLAELLPRLEHSALARLQA